ncbi:WXG100 family type VII secretion target [Streptomyces sp. Z26]|uniref:WXG100 family type VII secretion target n=1 Tax=Streptomyces TaxID=1883 RepID=UPI000EF16257|nr:WXG100 family type VII secretion target [Streptomyces sp. Z26]RLL69160.1 WXG100 family type VII secretion target [Streptomyces sp. Z26]
MTTSFDEQWARLHAAAAEETAARDGAARMRLASSGSGSDKRGGGPKLKVTPNVLRGKATRTDETAGDFMKADNKTMTETGQVGASLKGFACAGAFEVFQDRWKAQMRHVQGALKEGVADGLRSAATNFEASDKFPLKGGGDEKVAR